MVDVVTMLPPCYSSSLQTICLLPPGVSEYAGERCLLNCFPVLYMHGISDLAKAPCLSALLKNLHHILLDQYQYEEVGLSVCLFVCLSVCLSVSFLKTSNLPSFIPPFLTPSLFL